MEEALKDKRFSHILTDPRFRRIPKNVRKVKVDNRFKNSLKSKKFSEKCVVDERGRSLNLESSENLKKLYNLDEDSSESGEEIKKTNTTSKKPENLSENKNIKIKKNKKLAINKRNEKELSSDSEDSNCEGNRNKQVYSKVLDNQSKVSNSKNPKVKSKNKTKSLEIEKSEFIENKETESISKLSSNKLKNKKSAFKGNNLNDSSHEINTLDKISKKKSSKKNKPDSRFLPKNESIEESSSEEDNEDLSFKEDQSLTNFKESLDESAEESEEDSSSEEDSDDSASDKSDSFDHQWEEQHERAPDTDEITKRLAVCNMDWDRIRAVDLFKVFNSFKHPDSSITSVMIYPSEFGLKRMEEERLKGPSELVEKTLASDEEEVEDKKGGKYNREKLRQYQMNRLKYYYAVVECDTPETANTLYEQLNGMEYESSSVRFDLRFVPDDMTFDQEPSSVADNNSDLTEYKPRLFVTTALQQVKVGLTWDETDPHRRETLQKAFTEPESVENDIRHYLASSSGESEDEQEKDTEEGGFKASTKERIQKYKALLESLEVEESEKNKDKFDMEITWQSGVKETTENLIKEKMEEKSITPFEELKKKKKEKQKLKKKEKQIKNNEEEDLKSDLSDESYSTEDLTERNKSASKVAEELYLVSDTKMNLADTKSSKKKKKKTKQSFTDVEIDVNDERFSAVYTSPLFNIDPSDPHYKNTPGNLAIIAEKQRRLKSKALSQGDFSNKRFKHK